MPTLRKYGPDTSKSQKYPGLVRGERAGRCVKSELRSLTRKPEVETPKAGSVARAEMTCKRSCRQAQRRETGSQTHSTGEIGRQMPVIGERERGELPHPTSFSRAERPGERSKISIRVFEQETRGRETVGGPFCVPGSRSGGFSKDVAELVRVRAGYAQSEREKPEFSQIRLHPYQARQEIPAPCPMHLNAAR